MKKKPQERKLIFQDEAIFKSILTNLPEIQKNVIKLKEAYENLELSQAFDDEVFNEFITFGTGKTEKLYNDGLHASLNAIGAINKQIRANLLSNTETYLIALKTALSALKVSGRANASGDAFPINVISIVNGVPVVTDSGYEKIKEDFCRTYIETDIEHEVYNKLQNLASAYNSLLESFKETGYKPYFDMEKLQNLLSENELTKAVEVKTDATAFVINYNSDYTAARSNRLNVN
ncbi:hypothetical protein [Mucilaginibacter gotjawali]|uniref:Uncharacterized protein n=2 Tax=Mucilaginibacter gotjawali TaxID=1550579 RepID=A0A110B329_9SPHI|nr:hypothetical protein [Mucilaginibacter gotjawali]MBB3055834.1 hypothetical protein [Mucilaginibacter gotjawali]BAU54656.1 hypothetical protein MgSA37_02834 [Mucilaginibacter gotjawali]